MKCTFEDVIHLRGSYRQAIDDPETPVAGQGTSPVETPPEGIDEDELHITGIESTETNFYLATGEVPYLPDGYSFTASATTNGYRDPRLPVLPYRLQVNITTPTGMVGLNVTAPSRQFRNQADRIRTEEELVPPRSTATLTALGEANILDIVSELGQVMPRSAPRRYGHAYSAVRQLLATADNIDWSTGTHQLDTADMHAVVDFLVGFWDVRDLRTAYEDPQRIIANHTMPGDVVLPDPDPWPPRTPNHMPPITTRGAAAVGATAVPGSAYSPASYGHRVRPETLNASTTSFSLRSALAGAWRWVRSLRRNS